MPGDLRESNPETLAYIHEPVAREMSLQPPADSMQHAELSSQEQNTCPRPSPDVITIWLCPEVHTHGALCPHRGARDKFVWAGAGKRLRFPTNTRLVMPKKVFTRTKEDKVIFFTCTSIVQLCVYCLQLHCIAPCNGS